MSQGGRRSRVFIGVLSLGLLGMLAPGCKRSQVSLGRAHSSAEPAAHSGDAGVPPPPREPEPEPEPEMRSLDAGAPPPDGGKPSAPLDAGGAQAPAAPDAAIGGEPPALEPTFLPTPSGACPELTSGEVRLLNIPMTFWVGRQRTTPGPLLIYWHGVGSSTREASNLLGTVMDQILDQGGMVVALAQTTAQGTDMGTGTWYTGDFDVVDELVACAVASGRIDRRRIYTGGCSAGGLAAGTMLYMRSGYLAGAQLDSGGTILDMPLQDPAHVPVLIAAHGAAETDVVILSYAETSSDLATRVAADGGFAVLCDHGGGHCAAPPRIREAQWQLLLAHPYGTHPSPFAAGLPGGFPTECRVARAP